MFYRVAISAGPAVEISTVRVGVCVINIIYPMNFGGGAVPLRGGTCCRSRQAMRQVIGNLFVSHLGSIPISKNRFLAIMYAQSNHHRMMFTNKPGCPSVSLASWLCEDGVRCRISPASRYYLFPPSVCICICLYSMVECPDCVDVVRSRECPQKHCSSVDSPSKA